MRTTIDMAGRLVIPRQIRRDLGIVPGEVEIMTQGSDVLIRQMGSPLIEEDDLLLLPTGGSELSIDELRELRLADQR